MLNHSWARTAGTFTTLLAVVVLTACGRTDDRRANDSGDSRVTLRTDSSASVPPFSEWRASAGRLLLVATESPESAVVVFPEFTRDSSLVDVDFILDSSLERFDLFGPDGNAIPARLTNVEREVSSSCERWPVARVEQSGTLRPWTIGFPAGHAQSIAHASLDQLTGRDSAAVVVAVTRLASQAPNDTVAALRGLSYVVRSAYVAVLPDSQSVVVGEVLRRVNIEASPHEERTFVIGERDARTPTARYTLVFGERHAGEEESVPTTEFLALMRLSDSTIAAFAVREYSDGGSYLMLERDRQSRWRVRWQSAYAGC